jgi:hypothetical protein
VDMPGQGMQLLALEQPAPYPATEGRISEIIQDYVEFILSRKTEKLVCFIPPSRSESDKSMMYW